MLNDKVAGLSVAPLDGVVVGDGVDCGNEEVEDGVREEEMVEGVTEGNVSVGEEEARLQNCWASFSSVRTSAGQLGSIQANTSPAKEELLFYNVNGFIHGGSQRTYLAQ